MYLSYESKLSRETICRHDYSYKKYQRDETSPEINLGYPLITFNLVFVRLYLNLSPCHVVAIIAFAILIASIRNVNGLRLVLPCFHEVLSTKLTETYNEQDGRAYKTKQETNNRPYYGFRCRCLYYLYLLIFHIATVNDS